MNLACAYCGGAFEPATLRGRPRFCSESCRRAAQNVRRGNAAPRGRRERISPRRKAAETGPRIVRTQKLRRGRRPVATRAPYFGPPVHLYFD